MVENYKKPKVALIVLTANSLSMTREQLADIARLRTLSVGEAECIVVDNGSNDGTAEAHSNYKLPNMNYKFLQSGGNLGFAGGNNVGIRYALGKSYDYVVLMNNDLILSNTLLDELVGFMESNKEAGLCSPKMYFAKGYEFHKRRYKENELGKIIWYAGGIIDWKNIYSSHRGVDEVDKGQFDESCETDYANGACVIVRSDVFEKAGLLDEKMFLYWEDADLSVRAKAKGFKTYYYSGTHLWHKVSSSTGGSGSSLNDYFLTRNRFYFAMKHASLRTKIAVFRDTVNLIFKGRKWQKTGAFDAIKCVYGIGSWKGDSN